MWTMAGKGDSDFEHFDLDRWYFQLQDYTIPTVFMKLSRSDGEALIHTFEDVRKGRKKRTNEDFKTISRLEKELDAAAKQFSGKGCFVRLSSRSPKDAIIHGSPLERVRKDLKRRIRAGEPDITALFHSTRDALRVTSGREAVVLLTHSDHVYQDIFNRLMDDQFDLQIVVREWFPISSEDEFRAFVYNRKLTAITQYTKIFHSNQLVEKKQEVENRLVRFFRDSLMEEIPFDNCTVDLALVGGLAGDIIVVELNVFGHEVSAGLFDWQIDREILTGERPFEFRINETPVHNYRQIIAPTYARLLETYSPAHPYYRWRFVVVAILVVILSIVLSRFLLKLGGQ